ncbi:hypothetical protein [Streptomyces sp. NRRL B-24484]|uniref:hypothetical protein n=1 Tax=Streptomyces sp. NRRL B-24484 TaxID=1463833 RepID=UPI0005BAFD1F|nr:hypothetical protein [Streptomyces sp. NRRL B-24484]
MSTEPLFDPAAALPEAGTVRNAAERGDWPAVAAVFAECREEYGLLLLSGQVAAVPGVEHLLRQVLGNRPGDPLATALLADRLIHVGWQARTSRRSEDVTPEGWREFRARLNEAEQLLIGAVARDRGDALAWMLRVTISRGISLGISETRRRYRAVARVSPHHYAGQRSMLQQLLPKWGGSWEESHAFARDCFRAAPPGSLNGALLAMYHAERAGSLAGAERNAYAARADVRQELAQAAHGSVLHPDCRIRFGRIAAHSSFALLASLGGDRAAARTHFQAMGPYGSTEPWDWFDNTPERTFREHRDRALKG